MSPGGGFSHGSWGAAAAAAAAATRVLRARTQQCRQTKSGSAPAECVAAAARARVARRRAHLNVELERAERRLAHPRCCPPPSRRRRRCGAAGWATRHREAERLAFPREAAAGRRRRRRPRRAGHLLAVDDERQVELVEQPHREPRRLRGREQRLTVSDAADGATVRDGQNCGLARRDRHRHARRQAARASARRQCLRRRRHRQARSRRRVRRHEPLSGSRRGGWQSRAAARDRPDGRGAARRGLEEDHRIRSSSNNTRRAHLGGRGRSPPTPSSKACQARLVPRVARRA